MQTVVRGNGMVQLSLPSTDEGRNNHKRGLNGVNETMASRLAALTKVLKEKIPIKNGTINSSIKSREMKTEAKPSCLNGATIPLPNNTGHTHNKETASESVTKHCSNLVKKSSSRLASTQAEMEQRVTKSLHALRHKQLTVSHSHSCHQIGCQHPTTLLNTTSHEIEDLSSEATPPSGSRSTSVASNPSSIRGLDSSSSPPSCLADSSSHENLGLSSYSIQKHVQALRGFIDDDLTCSSSDEEEDGQCLRNNTHTTNKRCFRRPKSVIVKQRWEKDRAHIGSKWAWLCHQITSINQKIYQLDSIMHSVQPKESIQFVSHAPFSASCVCGLQQNGDSSLLSSTSPSKINRGLIGKYSKAASRPPCTCQIKQIILSNPSLMAQQNSQIKDLIEFSLPALLMEQSNQTCARTRMVRHAPKRKLLRTKNSDMLKSNTSDTGMPVDPSYHAFLSQPTDLSSSLWLDKAVHQILQEHSYASLPVQKKKKLVPPPIVTDHHVPLSLRLERSKSFSPSPPTPLDLSIERIGKGIPRKRNSSSITANSLSDDSTNVTTPTLPRKRKSTNTPQYDIDNIIIPYSMASSTRLEKLEYKEILTPKWQEKLYATANGNGVKEERDEEDLSDAAFQERHAKYEEKEKRRYLNFIGGSGVTNGVGGIGTTGRKRSRLNRSSTPELSSILHFKLKFNNAENSMV